MRIYCWFNANIDVIASPSSIPKRYWNAEPRKVSHVNGWEDLAAGLKYSMKTGKGFEVEGSARINGEERLGGTAAIFSNFISYRGWKVFLDCPMPSEQIARLFQAKSRVWMRKGRWIRADRIRGGKAKRNWIIEFKKGEEFGGVVAKSSSRFIVSSNPPEYIPNPPEWMDYNVIAGFNHLKPREIREVHPRGLTHLELTYPPSKRHLKEMRELSYRSSSVGMDYVEAEAFFGIREDVESFLEETDHEALFIHGKGYFAGMWRGGLKDLRRALKRAACDGAMYATRKSLRKVDCSRFKESDVKERTYKYRGRSISIVPYRVVEKPVRMTGLGDTISASIISSLFPKWPHSSS